MKLNLWADHPSTTGHGEHPLLWIPAGFDMDEVMNQHFVARDNVNRAPFPYNGQEHYGSRHGCFESSIPQLRRSAECEEVENGTEEEMQNGSEEVGDATEACAVPPALDVPTIKLKYLHFLQCDPIYRIEENGNFVALPRLNHEKELQHVTEAIDGKNIQLIARKLTFTALSETLSDPNCKVLHWASHGFSGFLGIEDHEELGRMNLVLAHQLKERVKQEAPNVELVVVSACCTEIIGKALVEAGVKNVVCVRHRSDIGDEAAIYFAKCFYKHLVSEKYNVEQAFNLARRDVELRHTKLEAEKFLLLRPDPTQPSMKIEISSPNTGATPPPILFGKKAPLDFPRPPGNLIGREKEIRLFNNAIVNNRLVCVSGPKDVGKAEVCAGACHYLWERLYFKPLNLNSIRWFVFKQHRPSDADGCPVQKIVFDSIRNKFVTNQMFVERMQENLQALSDYLLQARDLLVLEAKDLKTQNEADKMAIFVQSLLCKSDSVKVVVIYDDGVDVNPRKTWVSRQDVRIESMNMEMSLRLVKEFVNPEIISPDSHNMSNPADFCLWLYHGMMESWICCEKSFEVPNLEWVLKWVLKWVHDKHVEPSMPSGAIRNAKKLVELTRRLYVVIGNGKAKDIRASASRMNREGHEALVCIRNQITDIMLDDISLSALLEKKRALTVELGNAHDIQDYDDCDRIQNEMNKLETLLKNHPNLCESLKLKSKTEVALAMADHCGHWKLAARLKKTETQLQKIIEINRAAQEESVKITCPDFSTATTRFGLESAINKKCWSRDDAQEDGNHQQAKRLSKEIRLLKSLLPTMPPRWALETELTNLKLQKAKAQKDEMDSVVAVLTKQCSALERQINLEKMECQNYQRSEGCPICLCSSFSEE